MITIDAEIIPGKFIGTEEIGVHFFTILEKHGFQPDKINFYEPINVPYSLNRAVEMWADTRRFEAHIAGSMLSRVRKPNLTFMTSWKKGKSVRLSYITFWTSKTQYKAHKETYEQMYRDIFNLVEGVYGYITHEIPERRQYVRGSLENRMPGVFYCNYFGQPYVDFFGRDKILSGPWVKTEVLDSGTIVTHLSDDPNNKEVVESDELEMKAKHHLGIDSFGDIEWDRAHPLTLKCQQKNVPKLILPTIRVSIDH